MIDVPMFAFGFATGFVTYWFGWIVGRQTERRKGRR